MISWLTGKVAMYVCLGLLAVIAGMGVFIAFQNARLALCTSHLETAEVDIKRLKTSILDFQATIRDQNASIDNLKAEDEKRLKASQDALATARKATADAEGRRATLARLLAAPSPSGAKCDQAVQAVRKDLKP